MPELLGIIAPLRKFLSDTTENVGVSVDGIPRNILLLPQNREYIIPDFQREIRWDEDNLAQLVDDIRSGPKYLGNVILTQRLNENEFLIIDGQQRITILTMILSCLKHFHGGNIDTIIPCKLNIASFAGFTNILDSKFPNQEGLSPEILQSDKLHQIDKYYNLWKSIKSINQIKERHEAGAFIENLGKSNINIILNRSDDAKDGIRYFIDVNLKGKQLDTEDIFKGYLFRNDSGNEIRNEWYTFKTNATKIESTKMKYPLLKFLSHYFLCDLYNDSKFKGLAFDDEFLLKNEFKTHEANPVKFRAKTHLIEVINDNEYMINSFKNLNKVMDIMINIVLNDSVNDAFNRLFTCVPENERPVRIDPDELKIIHNFMNKILKDENILPKALIMKYILTTLLNEQQKSKLEYKKIYGVYLLSVLFVIFENKKSTNAFLNVLNSSDNNWYREITKQIKSYFTLDNITDNKIISQYKQGTNEDEGDYRFRCKSLATIYNFFKIENNNIILRNVNNLKRFISDENAFTTEHFIISDSANRMMSLNCNNNVKTYEYTKEFFAKYINSLFNFIFISRDLNDRLENYWLPRKLEIINEDEIECDYSKMIISKLVVIKNNMEKDVNNENYKDKLDLFFGRDFKDQYVLYARKVLDEVIRKINN